MQVPCMNTYHFNLYSSLSAVLRRAINNNVLDGYQLKSLDGLFGNLPYSSARFFCGRKEFRVSSAVNLGHVLWPVASMSPNTRTVCR